MNKKWRNLILLLILFSMSSCSSMFSKLYQKDVAIRTNVKEGQIYIDDELIGEKNARVDLKKDFQAKEGRIEKEGYKTEHFILVQENRPKYFLFNLLAGPVYGLVFLAMDKKPNAYKYNKQYYLKPKMLKYPKQKEGEKNIFLSKTALDLDEKDFKIKTYTGRGSRTISSDEAIKYDNSIFNEDLTELLSEFGYMDTNNLVLTTKMNTIYLKASIYEVKFTEVGWKTRTYGFNVSTKVKWEVTNIYDDKIYETKITSKSGEFAFPYFGYGKEKKRPIHDIDLGENIDAAMQDALTVSMIKLLKKSQVKSALQKDTISLVAMHEPLDIGLERNANKAISMNELLNTSVTIQLEDDRHGSGVVVSPDGYLLTNYNVINEEKEDSVDILFADSTTAKATVIRYNQELDVALLKIDTTNLEFMPVNQQDFFLGDDIFAIGTPNTIELSQTVSKGIVSGMRDIEDTYELMQTDVSINQGSNGGAIVDLDNKLIGIINTKIFGYGIEGIAFSIPIQEITEGLNIQ